MKHLKLSLLICFLAVIMSATAVAQRQKRPAKNPPQYPHIIDTSEQPPATKLPAGENQTATTTQPQLPPQTDLLLVKAVVSLTGEVRGLVQEMHALNVRQQAQIDLLRLTRADLHIEQYARELRTTRDRLALLKAEDQNLEIALRPENLELQVNNIPTFDRSLASRQIKANIEARQRVVRTELETLQQRELELAGAVETLRNASLETEKRLQESEETLRQMNGPAASVEKEPGVSQVKPDKP